MRINNIKKQRGFTLFELIIVVILLSIVSGFILIKFEVLSPTNKQLTLQNLKPFLLEKDYMNSLSLKCTDERKCLLFLDDTLQEDEINLKISEYIEVYEYGTELNRVFFKELELEDLQRENVIFEFTISSDNKHKDIIVSNDDKVYIFNSIYNEPIVKSNLSDVNDYFEELKNEVKDSAF